MTIIRAPPDCNGSTHPMPLFVSEALMYVAVWDIAIDTIAPKKPTSLFAEHASRYPPGQSHHMRRIAVPLALHENICVCVFKNTHIYGCRKYVSDTMIGSCSVGSLVPAVGA